MELTVDRLWLVAEGTVKAFDGDIAAYADRVRDERRGQSRRPESDDGRTNRKDQRRQAAESRRQNVEIRKAALEAEKRLLKLTTEREALVRQLGDPRTYNGSTAELQKMIQKKAALDGQIAEAEERWLAAAEALEAASA